MRISIDSLNGQTTVNLINGVPDLSAYSEPTLSILQTAFDAGDYVELPDPEPYIPVPDPIGFRKKLYGISDSSLANMLFHQVYIPSTLIATNPATAMAALTESRNILEGSFWNEPFSKAAFSNPFGSGSFDILKNFLTQEQIDIFTQSAIEFNLI
jgi:hypothetical protein